ncbi:M16 family metallopeptidase [Pseudoduganella sp. GCM10020061]|uniref:M16 family metallopeptidase n=1 Tax=Pseudoduganella sp. GCM10020061 TaxID=3317345 RepID=UPI00362BC881
MRSAVLSALLLATTLAAQAGIQLDQTIPVGPQVKVGKLDNGLTYYIQKNGKPEKKLELRLVVRAGSILEDDDQLGLAHFVEHMAFNGSTHFKKHELVSYLQSIGVQFGADLNAYTSFDETVYILPIPTERRENIEKGFTVLHDWAQGVSFNAEDIDNERGIVLEEARLGKGASDRMNKVLLPKIFNGSRYAERLPIGKEEALKTFSHDALRRFYRDWYRPDLMAVVAVGDIDPAEAERLIRTHFGKLKNPANPRPRVSATIAPLQKSEGLVITDKEANTNSVYIRYPVQEDREDGTFREFRKGMVETLFSIMLNARLQELAQQPEPPFVGGGSAMSGLVRGYKSFSSAAVLGRGGVLPAIDTLVQENERARKLGFSEAELDRAKKNVMRNLEREFAEREKTDSHRYAAEYIRNFLDREPIPGIVNEHAYVRELMPTITLDEMNRYARETIPDHAQKLVVFMGSDKQDVPIPAPDALLAAAIKAEDLEVTVRKEQAVAASIMDKLPKAGRIVAETSDAKLGITTLTLSNGVKVMLKPTDFRNDQVLMAAARYGGRSLVDDADIHNARYANAIAATMGVNGHSPVELNKILAGKAAGANLALTNFTDSVTASAGSTDIETMLQLVHLKFTSVRRDEDLYKSFIGKQRELARNEISRPESVFRDELYTTLFNGHPRVSLTPRPADFDKVSLDRSLDLFKSRFGSAKGLTFVFVGSFDPDAIKPLLATYLASLPVTDIPVKYRDLKVRPVTGVVKKDVYAGKEQKSIISLNFTGTTRYSELEQMRFSAMLEVMNLRINEVLREKLGLIYGGGVSGSIDNVPYPNYLIGATLPTGPQNVDKVIAATMDEIRLLKEKGPDPADLNKVKQAWLINHTKSVRENGYWLARIQNALLKGTDLHSVLKYEEMVKSLTPAQVQAAAKRYFNTGNYVQVVLYPEKAVANAAPVSAPAAASTAD